VNKPIEEVAQFYNVFTDNVGHTARQLKTELRRLSGLFGANAFEDMFTTIEYMQKYMSIDPLESVTTIQQGMENYRQFLDGLIPIDKLNEHAKQLQAIWATPEYATIRQKYTEGLGTLAKSYEELMATEPAKIEQFFARNRENLKGEMYSLATTQMPAFERVYKDISSFAEKYFGAWSPIAKTFFISPETGAPTFITALIPVVENLTNIKDLLTTLVDIAKATTNEKDYGTTGEWWSKWFKEIGNKIDRTTKNTSQVIASYPGGYY